MEGQRGERTDGTGPGPWKTGRTAPCMLRGMKGPESEERHLRVMRKMGLGKGKQRHGCDGKREQSTWRLEGNPDRVMRKGGEKDEGQRGRL